jgi:hypothetical protein
MEAGRNAAGGVCGWKDAFPLFPVPFNSFQLCDCVWFWFCFFVFHFLFHFSVPSVFPWNYGTGTQNGVNNWIDLTGISFRTD